MGAARLGNGAEAGGPQRGPPATWDPPGLTAQPCGSVGIRSNGVAHLANVAGPSGVMLSPSFDHGVHPRAV